jgi:lipoyl(octanoyl) transferase
MSSTFRQPVAWKVSREPVPYEAATAYMAERVLSVASGTAPELVWLLVHPPLYTAGTSAKPEDLVGPPRLPVHRTGRGGQFTYHGPGQQIAYVMLDVKRRFGDVRAYVASLEGWVIDSLAMLGVAGERQPGRVGVWIRRRERADDGGTHDKIAAIGVRLSRWVSSHGISLNIAPDLSHYSGIVPCGIRDGGITSLADLGLIRTPKEVADALRATFEQRFGATADLTNLPVAAVGQPEMAGVANESAPLPGGPDSWRARLERPS